MAKVPPPDFAESLAEANHGRVNAALTERYGELIKLITAFLASGHPLASEGWRRAQDVRRACSLLLAERERMATRAEEAERKLGDVAALQRATTADLDAARAQLRIVQAGREDVWHWQGDGRDDPASLSCPVVMSAETLRGLLATPLPAVAALLADLESMRDQWPSEGTIEAIETVKRHLGGAPSPLARVAAEAMALSPDDDSIYSPASMSDTYGKIRRLCEEDPEEGDEGIDDMVIARRDLARIARVALAGMLACDAAPADGAKGGA